MSRAFVIVLGLSLFACTALVETPTTLPDAGTPDAGTTIAPGLPPGSACTAASDCMGPNASCLTSLPGGLCTKDCVLDSQCPPGSRCFVSGPGGRCLPSCAADADCRVSEGYFCNTDAKTCTSTRYVPVHPGRAPIGDPCVDGNDCEGGACIPAEDSAGRLTGYTGGYCVASCNVDRPDSCPAGALCLNGRCRKACASSADCRGYPYACIDGTCRRDPSTVRVGNGCGSDEDCSNGARCIREEGSLGAFPGGMCVFVDDCDGSPARACGPEGACSRVRDLKADGKTYGVCIGACDATHPCRDGYVCDRSRRACVRASANPVLIRIGASCASDGDCDLEPGAGGVCARGASYPGGYCVAPGCSKGSGDPGGPTDNCSPAGGSCWTIPGGASNLSYCLKRCDAPADCREDAYACDDDHTCWKK